MTTSRRLQTKRQEREFERDAALIVGLDWLNERPSRARQNVIRLIELLIQADREGNALRKAGLSLTAPAKKTPEEIHLFSIVDKLSEILAAHKGNWGLRLTDSYEIEEGFVLDRRRLERDEKYYLETAIINYALALLRRGTISHLRTCRECKKWFYAVFNYQKHCSERCRQRFASHDQSFKDRRRKYMRNYRREERQRDQRIREGVRSIRK